MLVFCCVGRRVKIISWQIANANESWSKALICGTFGNICTFWNMRLYLNEERSTVRDDLFAAYQGTVMLNLTAFHGALLLTTPCKILSDPHPALNFFTIFGHFMLLGNVIIYWRTMSQKWVGQLLSKFKIWCLFFIP